MKKHSLQELVLGSETWVGLKKTTGPTYRPNESILWTDASYNLYLTPGDGSAAVQINSIFEAGTGDLSSQRVGGSLNTKAVLGLNIGYGTTIEASAVAATSFGLENFIGEECSYSYVHGWKNVILSDNWVSFLSGQNLQIGLPEYSPNGTPGLDLYTSPYTYIFGKDALVYDETSYGGQTFYGGNFVCSVDENGMNYFTGDATNTIGSYTITTKEVCSDIPKRGFIYIERSGAFNRYEYYDWNNGDGKCEFSLCGQLTGTYNEDTVIKAGALDINMTVLFGSKNILNRTAYSFVAGINNVVQRTGEGQDTVLGTTIFGAYCRAEGDFNFTGGTLNKAYGDWGFTYGTGNDSSSDWTYIFGDSNTISDSTYLFTIGASNNADTSSYSRIFGSDNLLDTNTSYIDIIGYENNIGQRVYNCSVMGTDNELVLLGEVTLTLDAGNNSGNYALIVKEVIANLPLCGRIITPDGLSYRFIGWASKTFVLIDPLEDDYDADDSVTIYHAAEQGLTIGDGNEQGSWFSNVIGANNTINGFFANILGPDNAVGYNSVNTVIFGGSYTPLSFTGNIVGDQDTIVFGTFIFGSGNEVTSTGGSASSMISVWGLANMIGKTSSASAVFAFGQDNVIDGSSLGFAFGQTNIIDLSGSDYKIGAHIFGSSNECQAGCSTMLCEESIVDVAADHSAIIASSQAKAIWPYSIVHAADQWETGEIGDQQTTIDVPIWGETDDNTNWTELLIGGTVSMTIESYCVYQISAMVLGVDPYDSTCCAGFEIKGVVNSSGGVTSVVGSPIKTPISSGGGGGEESWDVRLTTDMYTGKMKIEVKGMRGDGGTVRWFGSLKCIKQTTTVGV